MVVSPRLRLLQPLARSLALALSPRGACEPAALTLAALHFSCPSLALALSPRGGSEPRLRLLQPSARSLAIALSPRGGCEPAALPFAALRLR